MAPRGRDVLGVLEEVQFQAGSNQAVQTQEVQIQGVRLAWKIEKQKRKGQQCAELDLHRKLARQPKREHRRSLDLSRLDVTESLVILHSYTPNAWLKVRKG